jgi:hypothetical protein
MRLSTSSVTAEAVARIAGFARPCTIAQVGAA